MIKNAKQFWTWWTDELRTWFTAKFSPLATEANINTKYTSLDSKVDTIDTNVDTVVANGAKETTLTSTRTTLQNAIAALQGSDTTATLTAIKTIVSAISGGLTDADKTWLQQQLATIDLSSITSRLDNSTYGLSALKTAISSITFDTSTLAKEATLGTASDTASSNTIFGKIANLLSTWNTWISGAWATLVTNIASIKTTVEAIIIPTDYAKAGSVAKTLDDISIDTSTLAKEATLANVKTATDKIGTATSATNDTLFKAIENINFDTSSLATKATQDTQTTTLANIKAATDKIGTPTTGQATDLFAAIHEIDKAEVEQGVSNIQEALDISSAFDVEYMDDDEAEEIYEQHYADKIGRTIAQVKIDNQPYYLRTDKVYGGTCPEMSAAQDSIAFTGYGFTELWKQSGSAGSFTYTHYVSNPTAGSTDLDIDDLCPAANDYILTSQPTSTYKHTLSLAGESTQTLQGNSADYEVAFSFTNATATAYTTLAQLATAIEALGTEVRVPATGKAIFDNETEVNITNVIAWAAGTLGLLQADNQKACITDQTPDTLTDTVTQIS